MKETLQVANSPIMWILSILLISVVVVQSIIFFVITKKYTRQTNILSDDEMKKALKIGVIGTIGPAAAVFAVAVALITQIGGPVTFSRVGVIGSAAFEIVSAKIGSSGTLGTEDFAKPMLSAATWVMAIGGSGWLIMVLICARYIDKIQAKMKKSNPLNIMYMASFAPFAIFFSLSYNEVEKDITKNNSFKNLVALIVGALTILSINYIVKKNNKFKWLKEWAMAFSVLFAMIFGSLINI
ncbi:DUF5058 family protein [Oceanivirga salmonicida]|uniref:DUF5058 family protein n=1 Tax=Oceanivirga salmonicida TaxID=1769291 RepID=UPI00082F0A82|nr:DUF5058 family protein [Oceanivirga salmonicida]